MSRDKRTQKSPEVVSGSRPFFPQEIQFEDEMLVEGNRVNFYIPVCFEPAAVFGEKLRVDDGSGFVNVYANYDLDKGCVCDTLEITKVLDSREESYEYRLSTEEKAMLGEKMEQYHFREDTLQSIKKEYETERKSVLKQLAGAKERAVSSSAPCKRDGPEI